MNRYPATEVISVKELEQLRKDSNHLRMLINRGVDNWDGYVGPYHEECDNCGMDEDDCECKEADE